MDDLQPTWLGRGSRTLYSLLFVGTALLITLLFFVMLLMWIFFLLPGPPVPLSTLLFSSPVSWLLPVSAAFSAWPTQIKLKMRYPWQWKPVRRRLWVAHLGGIGNTLLWGGVSLSAGIQSNALWPALPFGLAMGLLGWLLMILLIGLKVGFSDELLPAQFLLVPKARVRESLKVGIFAALVGAAMTCLMFVGMIGIFAAAMAASNAALSAPLFRVFAGVTLGFAFFAGLMAWSAFGGYAYLLHVVLRLFLWRSRVLPRQIRAFLEDTADCRLLQPVGSGFQFVHPLVQKYFARLPEDHRASIGKDTSNLG